MNDNRMQLFDKWYNSLDIDLKEDICKWSAYKGWQALSRIQKVKLPDVIPAATAPSIDYHDMLQQLDKAGIKYE